jgi:hypothetical protein
MKLRTVLITAVVVCVLLSLFAPLSAANQKDKNKQAAKSKQQVFIPPEVKTVLQEGMATREGRKDIPVNIYESLFLPAQQNYQIVFFMHIKNADLGYMPAASPTPAAPAEPKAEEEKPEAAQPAVPAQETGMLEARFNVFLEFNRLEEGGQPQIVKEVYVPTTIQAEASSYNSEKEDMYSIGYPLPSGHYLLAMAVTSLDLQRIGTVYYEFTLPDASTFTKKLETTPIFFIKKFDRMDAPETHTVFHHDCFTYSFLKIVPNLEKIFTAGDNLDIFFFVFGARPVQPQQQEYSIEVNYEVKKGEEAAIRWAEQTYTSPLVSQPLPLKQTVIIKSQAGERTEERDLTAGTYTLEIKVLDKISENSVTKTVDFEVK